MKKSILVLTAAVLFLISCSSLQKDMVMSTDSQVMTEDVLAIEEKVAALDAHVLLNEASGRIALLSQEIDGEIIMAIDGCGMNKAVLARLYALAGRNALFAGNKVLARDNYNKSLSSCKGDSQTIILGRRLGLIKDLTDEDLISGSNENALIILEQGIELYVNGNYSKAVARMDSAFLTLPPFYQKCYRQVRENAWNLREVDSEGSNKKLFAILNQQNFTLSDMLVITQENSSLLNEFNGGSPLSENELYSRLQKAGMFNPVSQTADNGKKIKPLAKTQIMTRVLCARILWNIYCFRKNLDSQLTKYSKIYRERNLPSPIPDVDVSSEDFDAVIGSVEKEIIPLRDGKNFRPDENPSSAEYNSWIKKVK